MKGPQCAKGGKQAWPPPFFVCVRVCLCVFAGRKALVRLRSRSWATEPAASPRSIVQRVGIGAGPTKLQQVVEVGGGAGERRRGGERTCQQELDRRSVSDAAQGDIWGWVEGPRGSAALSSVDVTSVTAARALQAGDWPWGAESQLGAREG